MQYSASDDWLCTGTEQHERTSHACIDSAFTFIRDNYAAWTRDRTMAPCNFLPLPNDLSEYSPAKKWEKMQAVEEAAAKKGDEQESGKDKPEKGKEEAKAKDAEGDNESASKNGGAPETGKGEPETDEAEVKVKDDGGSKDVEMKVSTSGEQGKVKADGEQGKVSKNGEQKKMSTDGTHSIGSSEGAEGEEGEDKKKVRKEPKSEL